MSKTDSNGVATVKFNCTSSDFGWRVVADGYYRGDLHSEHFKFDEIFVPPCFVKVVLHEHEKIGKETLFNTVNFYSSMDEVVKNGNDKVDKLLSREYAWYNQERQERSLLVSFNPQAGWEFGNHYLKEVSTGYWNGEDQYVYMKYEPEETASIADTNLMVRPFFKDFRDEQIYGEGGSVFLQFNDMVRWYVLSHGIPAESFAASR